MFKTFWPFTQKYSFVQTKCIRYKEFVIHFAIFLIVYNIWFKFNLSTFWPFTKKYSFVQTKCIKYKKFLLHFAIFLKVYNIWFKFRLYPWDAWRGWGGRCNPMHERDIRYVTCHAVIIQQFAWFSLFLSVSPALFMDSLSFWRVWSKWLKRVLANVLTVKTNVELCPYVQLSFNWGGGWFYPPF